MHCISSSTTTNKSSYTPHLLLMEILRPEWVVLEKRQVLSYQFIITLITVRVSATISGGSKRNIPKSLPSLLEWGSMTSFLLVKYK